MHTFPRIASVTAGTILLVQAYVHFGLPLPYIAAFTLLLLCVDNLTVPYIGADSPMVDPSPESDPEAPQPSSSHVEQNPHESGETPITKQRRAA